MGNLRSKMLRGLKNPWKVLLAVLPGRVLYSMKDETYLHLQYRAEMGKKLNLKDPKTFNEKLQWLKLYDRKPEYTMMVDKYAVREYIAKTLGEEYLIPLLGAWEDPEEIDFDSLPDQFVLKCNHNSGTGMCICRDKSQLDTLKARRKLHDGIRENYYLYGREWPYKNVKRRILCEKYMTDMPGKNSFTDYKFYCFDGHADSVMVCLERESGTPKFYFFSKDWKLLRYNVRGKEAPENFTVPKPKEIDEMFAIAERLSKGIPHVRVDLYISNGQIYFGELTFFSESGLDKNLLPETDRHWGSLIDISKVKRCEQ